MKSSGDGQGDGGTAPAPGAAIAALRSRVDEERRRAARAESIAVGYESRLAGAPEQLRALRSRMATLHRQMEVRHKTSALLHELHAVRLEVWAAAGREPASPPGFMSTVASAIGVPSATAAVRGPRQTALIASSSDAVARAAHDVEVVTGEGPAHTAIAEGEWVSASQEVMDSRWPLFGPAVSELGIHSVLAVPLQGADLCLGTLCVYGQEPVVHDIVTTAAGRIAEAVTHTVLLNGEGPSLPAEVLKANGSGGSAADPGFPVGPLFAEDDYEPVVREAADLMAGRHGWAADDAEALIRARAFAESRPAPDVADDVLRGDLHLE